MDFLGSVAFTNSTTGWVVGEAGTIFATKDAGKNWARQESGTTVQLCGADFINERTGWVVGAEGQILATRNGGRIWSKQQTGSTAVLFAVQFVDDQNGWAVGREVQSDAMEWKRQIRPVAGAVGLFLLIVLIVVSVAHVLRRRGGGTEDS